MLTIRRSPLIDELSGDADIGTDHAGQVTARHGDEDVRGHAPYGACKY